MLPDFKFPAFPVGFSRYSAFLACFAIGFGTAAAQNRSVRVPLLLDGRSGNGQVDWRYSITDPGVAEWTDTAYDDLAWSTGLGGFGTGTVMNSHINTAWEIGSIWMRKTFTLPNVEVESIVLSLHHDEDVEVFLNGQRVYQETGWLQDYSEFYLGEEFKSLLRPGATNVLAVACRNSDGPGYIDAGLWVDATLYATTLVGDARNFPTEWSYVTADPGPDWYQPEFDAAAWPTGRAGFGSSDSYGPSTPWLESDIWMRTTFKAESVAAMYEVSFLHDDDLEIYVNGTLAIREPAFSSGYVERIDAILAKLIKAGDNTLAVHCANTGTGPQFVDVGILGLEKPTPVGLRRASRAVSGAAPFLRAGRGGVDVTALSRGTQGRLTLYGLDGRLLGAFQGGSGAGYLSLPVTLGTGVFRYHWDSPLGSRSGSLISLP